jgi:hypothetical protein
MLEFTPSQTSDLSGFASTRGWLDCPSTFRGRHGEANSSDGCGSGLEEMYEAFAQAQLRLGEKMYSVGIDNDELGIQIARVDADLRCAVPCHNIVIELRTKREKLLRRLADAALEDYAPLPGAQVDFEQAWAARAAVEQWYARRAIESFRFLHFERSADSSVAISTVT